MPSVPFDPLFAASLPTVPNFTVAGDVADFIALTPSSFVERSTAASEESPFNTYETVRQTNANFDYAATYQWIILAVVVILTVRNVAHIVARRNRAWRLCMDKIRNMQLEKLGKPKGTEKLGHSVALSTKMASVFFLPLRSKWACGLENPLQVFLVVASFAVNTGFVLGTTMTYNGPQNSTWNTIHVVALRCGWMSMAQLPAVIALTGRNSLVQFLTGIEYNFLRFAHKVRSLSLSLYSSSSSELTSTLSQLLAIWMTFLALVHTIDATMAQMKYFSGAGVDKLYMHNYLGQTGIAVRSSVLSFSSVGN